MHSRIPLRMLLLAAFTALLAGCQTAPPRQLGDAVERHYGSVRTLELPWFSIGERGAHEFSVAGLDARAFPYLLEIDAGQALPSSRRLSVPFDSALIRLDIISGGRVFATRTFRPTTWTFSRSERYEQIFWSKGQPAIGFVSDYTARVTVLQPSRRQWDKARLHLR